MYTNWPKAVVTPERAIPATGPAAATRTATPVAAHPASRSRAGRARTPIALPAEFRHGGIDAGSREGISLTPASGNDSKLTDWITQARSADLPHLHGFCNGLELDRAAVNAGLTLPWSNGRTEGVNTHTKRIMRQMHGRASFELLRHRILLNT